jgi:hypothetical protein
LQGNLLIYTCLKVTIAVAGRAPIKVDPMRAERHLLIRCRSALAAGLFKQFDDFLVQVLRNFQRQREPDNYS